MNYTARCLEKFRHLPQDIKDILGGFNTLLAIKKLEEKYGVSLSFLVVLVAIGELKLKDIPQYLEKKYGFYEDDAFDLWNELNREIFDSLLVLADKESKPESKSKEDIEEILEKGVKNLLDNPQEAEEINKNIFFLFSQDGSLPEKFSKVLLNNQERLTAGTLELNNKKEPATIANYLYDFIDKNGSELFSELVLEQYLSNSSNTKNLSPADKDLVRKVLKIYRNLSFFPESMDGFPLKKWSIFPVEDQEEPSLIRDVLNDDQLSDDHRANLILKNSKSPEKDNSLEEKLVELENNLQKYPKNSLEYKALSQEISHLKRASLKIAQKSSSQ